MDKLDKTKRFSRRMPWGEFIFVLVLLSAFIIKLSVFYDMFRLGGFESCFVFVSAAIVLGIIGITGLFSGKAARRILAGVYIFFSAVMAFDGVYFSYVSKLPSVAQLGMVANFGDIAGAILDLIKPKHIFLIADIPLWLLWAIDRDMVKRRLKKLDALLSLEKISRLAVSCVLIVAALGLGGYVAARADFLPEYLENEIFCYHFSDIYKVCFTKPEVRSVDKSKYLAEDCSESEYYGIAEGRNVFIIQVEAMQNFVLGAEYEGQELMPNLNALISNDSLYFKNYYYQIGGGNTADAEFAVNNSLFAPPNEAAYAKYPDNDYFGLPKLLKANGYTGAYAFHGYTGSFWNREAAYVGQGFDDYTSLEDFEQTDMFPMGLSDKEFFRQSIEKMGEYTEPFYSFMITLSSHYPFAIPLKDREITLDPEDESTLFGLYITSMNYTDRAIGQFIDELKDAGLYDNSVIVIYGDHYALTNTSADNSSRVGDMLGRSYTIYDVFNVPLIIHIPGAGRTEVIETAGGHLDVLPTLLCLLGIDNDKTVMFGQNLLTAKEGFVCEQTHMAIGSFISDSVFFKKPSNNIKTNYDAYEYGTMVRLNPDDFEEECNYAAERIADCASLLADNDILLSDIESDDTHNESQDEISTEAEKFDSVTFTAEKHPELDFGIWSHDDYYMIRDFAFTPQNTILILQMTGILCEYDFFGNLLNTYDYKLSEQGLSAFRVTAGLNGEIYLLDGHNNSILTGNREEITQVSFVNWNNLGMVRNYFECDKYGRPCLSAIHPTISVPGNVAASFTYALNVEGEFAEIEETMKGRSISGGYSFQVSKADETLGTREIYVDIFKDNEFDCKISVSSNREGRKSIVGIDFLGIVQNQFLLNVVEILDGYTEGSYHSYTVQTYLLVDKNTGEWHSCECSLGDNSLVRYLDENTYCLNRYDNSITIEPIEKMCGELVETDIFDVSVSLIEE